MTDETGDRGVQTERTTIRVADRSVGVRYHVAGDAEDEPPVVLLHGGGLDSAALSWKYALPALARDRRVYAPDLPGYGGSSPIESPTAPAYVESVTALIDGLDLDRVAVGGISLGGAVALGLGLAHPDRVSRILAVDSYGLGGRVPGAILGYYFVRLPFVTDLSWATLARSRRLTALTLRWIAHPENVTADLVDDVWALVRRPGAGETFRRFQRAEVGRHGLATNYADRLPELSVPTTFVHGEGDPLVPVSWAVRAHALVPDAELRVLADCGHWPPRERPKAFVRVAREAFDLRGEY